VAIADVDLKIPLKAADAAAVSSLIDGGFPTQGTGTYVLKPFRSPKSKKLKTAVVFVPRLSHFDINNEHSNRNEFRVRLPSLFDAPKTYHSLAQRSNQGFFTLFWISIFIWAIRTYVRSIETQGAPLNLRFATILSQDAWTLALSDAVLVLSTGICVPFAKAVSRGWIKYYWTGVITQHLLQTSILFAAITWTFNRSVCFVRVRRMGK
jgi:sterol O-acyltransferase